MKIKVSEATKEERTNLFNFLLNQQKDELENSAFGFVHKFNEIEEYLDLIQESISIQKFEIELDGIVKIIFNKISFNQGDIPEREFVLQKNGKVEIKENGKISKSVFYYSSFYEFEDNKFLDITNDDIIHFSYI